MLFSSPIDDDSIFCCEKEFRATASAIQMQYLFVAKDRASMLQSVGDYLQQYPNARMKQAVEFASRSENQPGPIEFFGIPPSILLPPKRHVNTKKHKKKIADQSKRRNYSH